MLLLLSAVYMWSLHSGEIKERQEVDQVQNNYKTGHTNVLHQLASEFSSHLIKSTGGFIKLLLSSYQNHWRLHQVGALI